MNNIDTLFQELVALDPSFAKHETEVRRLITDLLANKPNTKIDEEFVARLRTQLLGVPTPSPFTAFLSSPYLALGVLAVLLVVPLGFYATSQRTNGTAVFAMDQKIDRLEGNAYGTIALEGDGKGGGGAGAYAANTSAPEATAMAVATDSAAPADAKISTMAMGSGGDARMMLPVGPITTYSYVYKGDPLELSVAQGSVYSRVKNENTSGQIATQLRKSNFGLVNLGAFSDTKVQSFSLIEDKPYGYTIDVNFAESMININPNYTQWPSLNGKEIAREQLPKSAMPSHEELISLAKSFLTAHGISTTNYGDPTVQGDQMYATDNPASSEMYAPDQVTVTFPLKIKGTPVYEDGAYPYGLQVGVSIRDKRVMSVYGLTSQTYTSSDYTLVNDDNRILSVLEKGGPHAWVPRPEENIQIKKVEIEVGTPTKVLMHTYQYKDGQSLELFVPALSFPVTKAPEGEQYYPKNIVIPLVPELLENNQNPVMYDMLR